MNALKKLVYSLESTFIYESDEEVNNVTRKANGLEESTALDGTEISGRPKGGNDEGIENGAGELEGGGLDASLDASQENASQENGGENENRLAGLSHEGMQTMSGVEGPVPLTMLQSVGQSIQSVLYATCVHPVFLIWLLVTFPFTYIFGSEYPNLEASQTTVAETLATDEKAALLKEEKIMANSIKTPAADKYILPPPPRLFPLSRNPERKRRKKTLILDLDETLIHSLSRGAPRSLGANNTCHTIELKINNIPTLYYVYKRPFCDFFLKEVAKWFELQIFTASVKEYADPIIDWLESDIIDFKSGTQSMFTKRYYRSDCTFRQGVGYIKDLSKFCAKEEELKNVIILDNSPVSYALHEDNAIMIEGWINDPSDRDLLNLLPLLYSLSVCIDVRFVLGLRSGEKLFEAARS